MFVHECINQLSLWTYVKTNKKTIFQFPIKFNLNPVIIFTWFLKGIYNDKVHKHT